MIWSACVIGFGVAVLGLVIAGVAWLHERDEE